MSIAEETSLSAFLESNTNLNRGIYFKSNSNFATRSKSNQSTPNKVKREWEELHTHKKSSSLVKYRGSSRPPQISRKKSASFNTSGATDWKSKKATMFYKTNMNRKLSANSFSKGGKRPFSPNVSGRIQRWIALETNRPNRLDISGQVPRVILSPQYEYHVLQGSLPNMTRAVEYSDVLDSLNLKMIDDVCFLGYCSLLYIFHFFLSKFSAHYGVR